MREQQKTMADAETAYRKAIALAPYEAEPHALLGLLLRGDPTRADDAIVSLREAVRLNPKVYGAELYPTLAILLERKGQHGEALAAYREAVRLRPSDFFCHIYLAERLLRTPDPDLLDPREALRVAHKAQQLASQATKVPESLRRSQTSSALTVLVEAQYRNGQWRECIRSQEEFEQFAAQLASRIADPRQWLYRAMAHHQLGEKDEARKWHAKATEFMDQYRWSDEESARLRAEASVLLNIEKTTKDKGGPMR
jgi:tetratricopeptide (TPR) repeat protein